jgi:hypothetical protein
VERRRPVRRRRVRARAARRRGAPARDAHALRAGSGRGPSQRVDDEPRVDLERVAIPGQGEAQQAALDASVDRHARRPFDLGAGAPIRWVVFSLAPGRHALLRVWHHIMGDGLSGPVMRDDIARAYAHAVAGSLASFRRCVRLLRLHALAARSGARAGPAAARGFWKARLAARRRSGPPPTSTVRRRAR